MSISEFDLNNHLTVLKNIYPWLKEVNSQSLQQASKNLNSAYNHFFKDDSGFPKNKSKKNPIQSFQIPQHYRIEGKKIWIPKVGWIKIRKVIGSNNRRKAVKQLSKIHELISNQRNDFQHKVSKKLIGENQAVAVETLNIKGMLSNHHRAQSTGDSAWYSFVLKLTYKAEWFGKTVMKINQWMPSSKTCNICGYKHPNLTENIREWQCPECKTLHDRDINAAINIKNFALAEREVGLVDSLAKVRGMKQEASPSKT